MKRILLLGAATFALAAPAHAQDEREDGAEPIITEDTGTPPDGEVGEDEDWDVNAQRGPGRDVTINTSKGTWMSLDVSPDGSTIVFDMLGDLYTLPIGGGAATNISSGIAWDMQPVFSPDGSEIAFTSDRGGGDNLWVMNADGSEPRQVSDESFRLLNQPEWTPDGEFVVGRKHFTSSRSLGAGEMWLYHASGKGSGLQMTEKRTDQKDTGEPAFSPDGRYMYYSDDATPGEVFEYSKDVNGQIYVIRRLDRETGEIETLISGAGGAISPTPSPDGKSLAFIRRVRAQSVLMVMDLESGRITPVTDVLDRDMQETWAVHGVYPNMEWTPDNQSIVFWAKGGIHRADVATGNVTEIPFTVNDRRWVADAQRTQKRVGEPTFQTKALRFVSVSPDGSEVAFEALGKIHVRNLASGRTRALTGATDWRQSHPTWSADGRQIAWVEWDDQELGRIRVARADGSRARTVTGEPGHYFDPSFSADGNRITYRKGSGGFITSPLYSMETGIYVANLSGGEPMKLLDGGGSPRFSADGKRLIFIGSEGDKTALKSIDLETREQQTHLTSTNAGAFATSPDSNFVAWTERFQTYVIPIAPTGRTIDLSPKGDALPQTRVTENVGEWVQWANDGNLYWTEGPILYSRRFDAVSDLSDEDAEATQIADLSITANAAEGNERYVLSGARIVTMNGDEVIENGAIMVDNNRITAVGPLAAMSWEAGTRVIDVTGKTIIPGLVDAHWHGPMATGGVIPQQNWAHAASIAYGVTAVHDPSNDTTSVFAASEHQKAGLIVAPRIFSTGTILYGATTAFTAEIESLDDARGHLRRLKAKGAWSVKSYNQPRRDQRQMVMEAARELDMDVMPEGGSLFMHNMTMVADGHTTIEHALPVQNIYDDVLQFWGGQGVKTAYTPTLNVAYGGPWGEMWWYMTTDVWADPVLNKWVPRGILDSAARRGTFFPEEENNLEQVAEGARMLYERGVPANIGPHGQREGLGAHWEIWTYAELGDMSPLDAIRTATMNPAYSLGIDTDLGSIQAGKLADMVILDENPLENIRHTASVNMVMQGGILYDGDMQVVAGGTGGLEPFWFQDGAGEAYSADVTVTTAHEH